MTEDQQAKLVELVGRIDERLKVVERFVYGFVSVVGGAVVLAGMAVVIRTG